MLPIQPGIKRGGALTNKSGIKQFLNYTPIEVIPEEPETVFQLKSKSKSEINTSSGEKTSSLDQISHTKLVNQAPGEESYSPSEEQSQKRNSNPVDSEGNPRSGYLSKSEDEASRRTSKKPS